MTASVSLPSEAPEGAVGDREFDLVESSAGWLLTITLTEQLRQALAGTPQSDAAPTFRVRVSPNLVPGEPFDVTLAIRDPEARPSPDGGGGRRPLPT